LGLVAAHHEKQCGGQAGENGQKSERYKVCHAWDYELSKRYRSVLLLLGALIAFGVTLALGNWQLDRAAQKRDLEQSLQAAERKPVVDTTALLGAPDAKVFSRQRALLQGQWLAQYTVFLDNRQMNAKVGFFVMTPLQLKDSSAHVWVQRGWAARNFQDRNALPNIETPDGLVTVEGRIVPPPSKLYEPGPASTGAIRQNLDLDQFRSHTGLSVLPVTLQQTGGYSEGLLRQWPVVGSGIDKHYGYAFQWFGLSALIALLTLWFQVIQPYLHRTKDLPPHV
jgi:surfeit locus 1 family protein